MFDNEFMRPYFDLLLSTKGVEQRGGYHPEGDVYNHSMQVLHHALSEADSVDLVISAMLHDVGKVERSHGHEQIGGKMLDGLATAKVLWLVRNHMLGALYIDGTLKKHSTSVELADHPWFSDLMQLVRWDRMGRVKKRPTRYNETRILKRINEIAIGQFHGRRR